MLSNITHMKVAPSCWETEPGSPQNKSKNTDIYNEYYNVNLIYSRKICFYILGHTYSKKKQFKTKIGILKIGGINKWKKLVNSVDSSKKGENCKGTKGRSNELGAEAANTHAGFDHWSLELVASNQVKE